MDKFEEMMQMMQGMSEEERMQSIQEKKNICTCADAQVTTNVLNKEMSWNKNIHVLE